MADDPIHSADAGGPHGPAVDLEGELRAIAAGAEALVAWEEQVGGLGFPRVDVPDVATARRPPAATRTQEGPQPRREPSPRPAGRASHSKRPPASPPAEQGGAGSTPQQSLHVLASEAAGCTRCELHHGRTKSVFARGSATAELVFVGEGPGYHEDQQGLPFVGAAGQLLDKMIAAMGYGRDDVYICNVVKCRPPENRTPLPREARSCEPFLTRQLEVVAPKAIVALGKCATENLGCLPDGGRRWRGHWREYRGVPVMPTYHPAFLLRSPQYKRAVWDDLRLVMKRLGRSPGQG